MFGGFIAVDRVDLESRIAGCTLIGPNGAGKTTVQSDSGMFAPDRGR